MARSRKPQRRSLGDTLQRLVVSDPEMVKAIEHIARKAEARARKRMARAARKVSQKKASSWLLLLGPLLLY